MEKCAIIKSQKKDWKINVCKLPQLRGLWAREVTGNDNIHRVGMPSIKLFDKKKDALKSAKIIAGKN